MEISFTEHAKEMMKKRNITKEEVVSAMKYPDKTFKRRVKYFAEKYIGRAKIEAVSDISVKNLVSA